MTHRPRGHPISCDYLAAIHAAVESRRKALSYHRDFGMEVGRQGSLEWLRLFSSFADWPHTELVVDSERNASLRVSSGHPSNAGKILYRDQVVLVALPERVIEGFKQLVDTAMRLRPEMDDRAAISQLDAVFRSLGLALTEE